MGSITTLFKINNRDIINPEEISDSIRKTLFEGAKKTVTVNAYERNRKAKEECLKHWGTSCSVCGFNFEKTFGKIGKNFIHIHHLIPISKTKRSYQVDPINDLRPVCPNCHSMLHKNNPPYTIEELKNIINNKNNSIYD